MNVTEVHERPEVTAETVGPQVESLPVDVKSPEAPGAPLCLGNKVLWESHRRRYTAQEKPKAQSGVPSAARNGHGSVAKHSTDRVTAFVTPGGTDEIAGDEGDSFLGNHLAVHEQDVADEAVSLLHMVVVADTQEAYIVALAVGGTAEPCLGANTPEYPFCVPGDPDPRKCPAHPLD